MICRLCSKECEKYYDFFDDEGIQLDIVNIVAKHFWFEPKIEDKISHQICADCWLTTQNFHELYMLVQQVEEDWKKSLTLIKSDPCNELAVTCDGYLEESSTNCDTQNSFSLENDSNSTLKGIFKACVDEMKLENGEEDSNSEIDDQVDNEIESDHEQIIESHNTRGRSAKLANVYNKKTKRKPRLSKRNDDEEHEKRKREHQKRTPEETAAFNKKVAEGDALIARFMKIYCNTCSEEQINFTTLKHHCRSVHNQQGMIVCCERKFYRKSKLVEHIEKHIDPEKHKCHICDHVSANRWNLKIHMDSLHSNVEDKVKPFKCCYCGKNFKLQTQLFRHELTHLPEEQRKFKCSYCKKNFPSEASLKYHIRLCHEGYYSGVCDICGKAYNNRQDLKRHRLLIHEGVERTTFKCKYCDMEFNSKYTYNIHKFREHENQNPNVEYKCTHCNKISANSEALKNHIQYVHKAKAKFECALCDKVFKRELALREHTAAHTGQSLYSCPHCPKTFTHSSNMHHHRKLKHPLEFEIARKIKEKKETWRELTSLSV